MSADLQRATELRWRMTADLAHDLRTPLTVIAGYLEALRDESLRPTPARFAAMHDETQVLLRLVEDLHTLSLADAGKLVLRRQQVEPAQLLSRVAQTYHDAAALAGVDLRVEPAPGVPALWADGEPAACQTPAVLVEQRHERWPVLYSLQTRVVGHAEARGEWCAQC